MESEKEKKEIGLDFDAGRKLLANSGSTDTEDAWYFRPWIIAAAILGFGPLGLILLWFRPGTHILWKSLISVIVLSLTVLLTVETVNYYQIMMAHIKELSEAM
ncbi:MAG: hypothetical protein ABH883_00390 [Candidatus Omnitrophota bacterium]